MNWTLVTGAARGVGAEIARFLARSGHPVVIHYNRSQDEANALVETCRTQGGQAECIQGDFSSPHTTRDFARVYYERFPHTAHFVYNVGNYLVAPLQDTREEAWYELFETNLHAPFLLAKALQSSLVKHRGSIVTLGYAGTAHYCLSKAAAYAVTKSALWMLTRLLANELAPYGVRANMVSPGKLENTVDPPANLLALPMGRLGRLEEVARTVAFLLDAQNSYITGQNIEVAGGVRL